jgi:hypothetical protein
MKVACSIKNKFTFTTAIIVVIVQLLVSDTKITSIVYTSEAVAGSLTAITVRVY